MRIVLSIDVTGPDPKTHEVLQVGAVFCSGDFRRVYEKFSSYLRPLNPEAAKRPYLQRVGLEGAYEMKKRMPRWGRPDVVWEHFSRVARRHSADPGQAPEKALEKAQITSFDGVRDALFLRRALIEHGPLSSGHTVFTEQVSSLASLYLDSVSFLSYIGVAEKEEIDYESVFEFFNVDCKRPSDALRRAEAVRESYLSHFKTKKQRYDAQRSSGAEQSSSRPKGKRSRGRPGRGRSGRSGPILRP